MKKKTRKTFSPEFRLETAQLVADQQYTQKINKTSMIIHYKATWNSLSAQPWIVHEAHA
ncbi:hypothetical protein RS130_22175 [Paraglaciecola aquimarina]|uniref:Transposase n=1 Tax=Paraglaciecola aquimarina TaxID=1235557 RepID=A0ABU3T1T2_9ALTE|nr:hypothetical protein [Paraglaciecola aquimarina]MDU0356230.1 hypothetical protein [Paraglaciecola aquimarina]